jgi:hypothetical protein
MQTDEDDAAAEIESLLCNLEECLATPEFRSRADAVQSALKAAKLRHDTRQELWQRYQGLWSRRRSWLESRDIQSEVAFRDYESRLLNLHTMPNTIESMTMDSGDWGRIGEQTRAARAELRQIQTEMKEDGRLVRNHREKLFRSTQDAFRNMNRAEDAAFYSQEKVAGRLLNEASSAVDSSPIRDAWEILKANTSQMRALYLKRDVRDMYNDAFNSLWDKLKAQKAEAHERWRERQEEGLRRLNEALDKAQRALERVNQNISDNEDRLATSSSDDFSDRVQGWISEGREKAADIERSIASLEEKIRDAESRLNK